MHRVNHNSFFLDNLKKTKITDYLTPSPLPFSSNQKSQEEKILITLRTTRKETPKTKLPPPKQFKFDNSPILHDLSEFYEIKSDSVRLSILFLNNSNRNYVK